MLPSASLYGDLLEQILIAFLLDCSGTSKVLVVIMDTHGPLVYCIVLYVQDEAARRCCCQLLVSPLQCLRTLTRDWHLLKVCRIYSQHLQLSSPSLGLLK